jgi:chloramphenicol-sensitive protein RarD
MSSERERQHEWSSAIKIEARKSVGSKGAISGAFGDVDDFAIAESGCVSSNLELSTNLMAISPLPKSIENTELKPGLGIACAIAAQMIWGCYPLYVRIFKSIIEPLDFVAHRAIWSFSILILWMVFAAFLSSKNSAASVGKRLFGDRSVLRTAIFATVMLAINWLMFIWAVNNDHALDASLGYYICPQVIVLLGVIFLRERLNLVQQFAFVLASIGVGVMTFSNASKPWIGVVLAVAFGIYALIKKKTKLSSTEGLTLETGIMLLPAIGYLFWRSQYAGAAVFAETVELNLLLVLSGLLTVAPLVLLAIAVKHIPLSTAGLLQFIGPTIQFFLGVFVFGEPFDQSRSIGFVFVWLGVGLFLYGMRSRKT